ncbi:MAG TPA: hypothetical protein VFO65_07915 [Acidimicrobiales bacterium]|nr:hypothetical protein [Acidimicrobiales bacterium]
MKHTTQSLAQTLEQAAGRRTPPPRVLFLDNLEARLVAQASGLHEVVADRPAPAHRRRALVWLAPVAMAAVVGVASASVGDAPPRTVDTAGRPSGPGPVVTKVPPTTAVAAPAATTPPTTEAPVPTTEAPPVTEAPKPTTTVAPKPPTTVVQKPVTTAVPKPEPVPTTAKPEPVPTTVKTTVPPAPVETLAFECRNASAEGPAVACSWSASTAPDWWAYRLIRKGSDGTQVKALVTEDPGVLSFTDTAIVAGVTYTYWVEAKSTSGTIIGKGGPVTVECC